MRDHVAPGLRSLGFKGSGQAYQLPSESHWALLGFQKGPASDARAIVFTANLQVVLRSRWEAERHGRSWMPERPTATTGWPFAWWVRLGELIPGGDEIWWEVSAGKDTTQLADAILWAVEDYGLPAMRATCTDLS